MPISWRVDYMPRRTGWRLPRGSRRHGDTVVSRAGKRPRLIRTGKTGASRRTRPRARFWVAVCKPHRYGRRSFHGKSKSKSTAQKALRAAKRRGLKNCRLQHLEYYVKR